MPLIFNGREDFHLKGVLISSASIFAVYFGMIAQAIANPIPDYYSEPGFNAFRSHIVGEGTEVIDPFSGGLNLVYNDIIIPGNGGLDLVAKRTYRSLQGVPTMTPGSDYKQWSSPLGMGWDMHFGRVWTQQLSASNQSTCKKPGDASQNPVLELSDGTRKVLFNSSTSDYAFITKDRWIMRCEGSYIKVFSPDGVMYKFEYFTSSAFNFQNTGPAYHVTEITDINGNKIIVEYDESTGYGILDKAYFSGSASNGINFTYNTDNYGYHRLTRISANGQQWDYSHKQLKDGSSWQVGYYYLTSAEPPVGSSWYFTYYESVGSSEAGRYSLKSVENPGDTKNTYEYKFVDFANNTAFYNGALVDTTVVSKKIQSGGGVSTGTWTYSYDPGSSTSDDKTTVIDAEGNKKIYRHFGIRRADDGTVWKIGTLSSLTLFNGSVSTLQTETYTWSSETMSSQNVKSLRETGDEDINVYAPLLTQKVITRDGSSFTTSYSNFDFGSPKTISESGSDSRTNTLTYTHIKAPSSNKWRLGLVNTQSVSSISGNIDNDYDSKGNLIKADHYGAVDQYSRCSHGEVNTHTNPNGHKTVYSCSSYKRGIPGSETRGNNSYSISRSVNNDGTIGSVTIAGKKTSYQWDNLNRITQISTPDSGDANISISWTSNGRKQTINRGSFSDIKYFDGLGRLKSRAVEGLNVTYSYDKLGQKTYESNIGGSSGTSYDYDGIGRIKSINPPGSGSINYSYFSSSRVKISNERGKSTTYSYQTFGDPDQAALTKIAQPEGITTTINRNNIGLIGSVSQGGATRSYGYNSRKQLTSISHPEFGTERFGRDHYGNMVTHKLGSGSTTTYIYDSLERLTKINYGTSDTPNVEYTYYAPNLIKSVEKGSDVRWDYKYNDNDILEEETLTLSKVSPARTYKFGYTLNSLDNVSRISYPSGKSYTYTVNDLGRVTRISQNTEGTIVSSADYFPNGAIHRIDYRNGVTSSFGQDNRYRIDSALTDQGIYDASYSFDSVGNLTQLTDHLDSAFSYNSLGYDDVDRLERVNGATVLTYDSKSNIKFNKLNGIDLTYSYSGSKLSTVSNSSYSFTYDLQGNVINNGIHQFDYDDANHLRSVVGLNWQIHYDGNGMRVLQEKSNGNIITVYGRSGQLLFEEDEISDSTKDYIYIGRQLVSRYENCQGNDRDNDGLPGCFEHNNGLSDHNAADALQDTDGDGLTNLAEYNAGTNLNKADTDADGLTDSFEINHGLNPTSANYDVDGDGLSNSEETTYGTNPLVADTDGDGVPDRYEIIYGNDPLDNTDVHTDTDQDGLTFLKEYQIGTKPNDSDSDNDNIQDGYEYHYGLNPLTNDSATDTDNDGLTALDEYIQGTDPNNADTDGDGEPDGTDPDPLFNVTIVPITFYMID